MSTKASVRVIVIAVLITCFHLSSGSVKACGGDEWKQARESSVYLRPQPLGQGKTRELPLEAKERMRRAAAAVGLIFVSDGNYGEPRPRGSGVVVRQDGVIATNLHVIMKDNTDQPYKEIYFSLAPDSGTTPLKSVKYRLRVAEIDRRLDLVLLTVISPAKSDNAVETRSLSSISLPVIDIGDSRAIELLDDLVIIGFPEKGGSTATLSRGVVEGKDTVDGWIKTDTRLLHGNSGGAAVNAEGKLIGIATKVEIDRAPGEVQLGSVGYLRPAHFIAQMLDRLRENEKRVESPKSYGSPAPPATQAPSSAPSVTLAVVKVRGIVKSASDGKPVAGARVGLIIAGRKITPETLISWGGTNADGYFQLEKPVSPGRYTLRAKVVGDERYALYNQEIEIKPNGSMLIIELQPARNQ